MTEISVLHVDDDRSVAELTAEYLGQVAPQLSVDIAESGSAGMDRLETAAYDCVVSDYDMPGMDGLDFLETVRDRWPDLPFILFTGKGSEDIASDAISAGVTDYLQKATGTEQYELLANRIENAVSQYRAQKLADQQARINEVVRATSQAVIAETDPEAIVQAACDRLAGSTAYEFSVFVEADPETRELEPMCWAGTDDFLDVIEEVGVRMDESPLGQGPGGRAARSGEVQIIQDFDEDPNFEPWREGAEAAGFRSLAAIPLIHEDSLEGVLGLFADRERAFEETERTVLSELGNTIAFAIKMARERRGDPTSSV